MAAHRVLEEAEWSRVWRACPVPTLPDWVRPRATTRTTEPDVEDVEGGDDVATRLLATAREAATLLEIRASSDGHGALGAFAVHDATALALVRELYALDDTGALHPVRGLRLGRLDVDDLLEAAMALVPPDRERRGRRPVRLPADHAFALADVSRTGSGAVWQEAVAQLADGQDPGVLRALARGVRGTLDVRLGAASEAAARDAHAARHARGEGCLPARAFASWLLTDEGWVFVHASHGHLLHVPVGRSAIRARLLSGLTSQLAAPAPTGTDAVGGDHG